MYAHIQPSLLRTRNILSLTRASHAAWVEHELSADSGPDSSSRCRIMWPLSVYYVLMLLVSWRSAVAQMCTLPEVDDYQRLLVDTYTSVAVDQVADAMYLCVSDDGDTATLAVKYSCIGQECEHSTVEGLIDLQCSAGMWTTTGRIVTKISNREQGSNCSICMNATERDLTYPDDERSTYSEENHCLGTFVLQYYVPSLRDCIYKFHSSALALYSTTFSWGFCGQFAHAY